MFFMAFFLFFLKNKMAKTAYAKKAEDYAAHRPPYSDEAFSVLFEKINFKPSWVVNNGYQRFQFPMNIKESWPQFIGGMRSVSYNPSMGDEEYDTFEQEQKKLFDSQAIDGIISIDFVTELAFGRVM